MDKEFNSLRYAGEESLEKDVATSPRIRTILEIAQSLNPRRILDVGCADGFLSRLLVERTGARVVGLDNSQPALEKAAAVCEEVHMVDLGDGTIPLPDGGIDLIIAGEVIEHVFHTERLLEELHRVAAPGAHLLLTTPNLSSWYNRVFVGLGLQPLFLETGTRTSDSGNRFVKPSLPAGHIRLFTPSSLRDIGRRCGWHTVKQAGAGVLSNKWKGLDVAISASFPSLASDIVMVFERRSAAILHPSSSLSSSSAHAG